MVHEWGGGLLLEAASSECSGGFIWRRNWRARAAAAKLSQRPHACGPMSRPTPDASRCRPYRASGLLKRTSACWPLWRSAGASGRRSAAPSGAWQRPAATAGWSSGVLLRCCRCRRRCRGRRQCCRCRCCRCRRRRRRCCSCCCSCCRAAAAGAAARCRRCCFANVTLVLASCHFA